jgi:MOSC domain-containing protein YiiM
MKETRLTDQRLPPELRSFLACLATILELPIEQMPQLPRDADPENSWHISRWLGGPGLGLVPVTEPATFAWAGPWIARVAPREMERRYVVMYGVPSGVVWDPDGSDASRDTIDAGFVVAASDIALALPSPSPAPATTGTVVTINIAATAGEPTQRLQDAKALAGQGLAGDRHLVGQGTFPSHMPGSALTLIDAEVCESFDPPLEAHEHRRNLVTRGINLNGLVGREFMIGEVRCRGMRLCEPCTVVQGYSSRAVLRPLVHRGGVRADILTTGTIHNGDPVRLITDATS